MRLAAGSPARSLFARTLIATVAALALALVPVASEAARAARVAPAPLVAAVDAVGMTVADADRAVDFYTRVLSFEKESDVEVWGEPYEHLSGVFGARMRIVRLRLGDERIELTEFVASKGRPIPVESRSNDLWFQHVAIVVSDMARAYEWLRKHKVTHASTGPQRLPDWNPNAGGIEAFYFKDPDGHPLEIISFPNGKGDPKWKRPTDRLFLGIDHTAIVVADTDESLAFYRDVLGLKVAGESENHGSEQERLNNVFGARLRITGLRAENGIGVEFLEYLAPRDGRPYPSDARASDVVHRQTHFVVGDAAGAARALRAARARLISPGTVVLPDARLGFSKGLLARDPDGHALALVER